MKKIFLKDLSLFEIKVYHFALWKYLADNANQKKTQLDQFDQLDWPGWKLFAGKTFCCFLCGTPYSGKLSVLCGGDNKCYQDCLSGLYSEYKKSLKRLQVQPGNWAYQKNYKKICMKIALVEFKDQSKFFIKTKHNLKTIENIKLKLKLAYCEASPKEFFGLMGYKKSGVGYSTHDFGCISEPDEYGYY